MLNTLILILILTCTLCMQRKSMSIKRTGIDASKNIPCVQQILSAWYAACCCCLFAEFMRLAQVFSSDFLSLSLFSCVCAFRLRKLFEFLVKQTEEKWTNSKSKPKRKTKPGLKIMCTLWLYLRSNAIYLKLFLRRKTFGILWLPISLRSSPNCIPALCCSFYARTIFFLLFFIQSIISRLLPLCLVEKCTNVCILIAGWRHALMIQNHSYSLQWSSKTLSVYAWTSNNWRKLLKHKTAISLILLNTIWFWWRC